MPVTFMLLHLEREFTHAKLLSITVKLPPVWSRIR